MKNYQIHIAIVNALILISMFFAYQVLSEYQGSWNSGTTLREGNRNISGFNLPGSYVILGVVLLISFITLIHKSVATSIIGSILSFGLLLYIPVLAFVLTFSLLDAGDDLGFGFYLGSMTLVYLFIIQMINLVTEIKNRKRNKNVIPQTDDILDDF